MDILITGGQGCGKTKAAHKLIADHFGVEKVYNVTVGQLLILGQFQHVRADILRETIRVARVEAVLLDGCLHTAGDLMTAIEAVKQARQQTGRDLYAVYVRQTDGVCTTAKYPDNIKKLSDLITGITDYDQAN